MITFYGLQEVNSYILSQEVKGQNGKHFLYTRVVGLEPGTSCFTKIAVNHARFFRAFNHLSNNEHLLLRDFTTRFINDQWWKEKMHLMILSQGSYGLYPAGNFMLRVNNSEAKVTL